MEREEFFRIAVRVPSSDVAERVTAEAWAAGAAGLEERDEGGEILLLLYAAQPAAAAVANAAQQAAGSCGKVGESEAVEAIDWSERWKQGLEAIVISERLVVRPSFVSYDLSPGQRELVIDPGRAFGTGGHASTALALQWIDAQADSLSTATRVLDIGTGTGVLGLAALCLGAGRVVAFDTDSQACCEARRCAACNGMAGRLQLFSGPIQALDETRFDLVIANLLRSELLPLAPEIAARTGPGSKLIVSGLLRSDRPEVETRLSALGFRSQGARVMSESSDDTPAEERGDDWVSLLLAR